MTKLILLIDKKRVASIDKNTVLGVEKSPNFDFKLKYDEKIEVFKFMFSLKNLPTILFFAKSEEERDDFFAKIDQFLSIGNIRDIEIDLDSELNKYLF